MFRSIRRAPSKSSSNCMMFSMLAPRHSYVDGLVGVSDDEHVVAVVGQLADEDVLRQVRVLVLVDQQVLELVLVLFAHVLVLVEQPDAPQHHVVEVEHVRLEQPLLVAPRHLAIDSPNSVFAHCPGSRVASAVQ